jgi:hypothetical protein
MFFTPVSELRRNKKGNHCPTFMLIWEAKYTITVMQQFGMSGNEMIQHSIVPSRQAKLKPARGSAIVLN